MNPATAFVIKYADVLTVVGVSCTGLAFLLRRMFGEQRSEQFAAFERKWPRPAAAIALLDLVFFGAGGILAAVVQIATGKAPETTVVTIKKEEDK